MVGLPESRFCPEVYRGTAHLMVGSPTGVEVVAGKVLRKILPVAARCSDDDGRFL